MATATEPTAARAARPFSSQPGRPEPERDDRASVALAPTSSSAEPEGGDATGSTLPTFEEKERGRYTNAEIRDVLRYLLRDGILPEGTTKERGERQQRNYKYHRFVPEIVQELQQKGIEVHADFRKRDFWKEWRRINHSSIEYATLWPQARKRRA